MTLAEVAEFLFVSRVHVKKLLESGVLKEVLPRSPCGTLNIETASVERYKAAIAAAQQDWIDSQTEGDDWMTH